MTLAIILGIVLWAVVAFVGWCIVAVGDVDDDV